MNENDSLTLVVFLVLVILDTILEYLHREYWLPRKGDEEAEGNMKATTIFPLHHPGKEAK